MRTITGVFTELPSALRAARELQPIVGRDHVNLLAPGTVGDTPEEVPTTDDMAPVGAPLGGIVGGTLGVVTALAIPGIGSVTALGVLAAAALGVIGGTVGYKLGDAADRFASTGLPVDELYLYEDALKQGRSVVFALVDEKHDEDAVRKVFAECGAESLDPARDDWTVGLHDAEESEYEPEKRQPQDPSLRD